MEEEEKEKTKKVKASGWFVKSLPNNPRDIEFTDLTVSEVVNMLNLIDAEMMRDIPADDFVFKFWVKKNWSLGSKSSPKLQPQIWVCIKRWVKVSLSVFFFPNSFSKVLFFLFLTGV